jgi:hypothetical protein
MTDPPYKQASKESRMEITCDDDASDLDDTIVDFCDYAAEHLVLDELRLVLCTTARVARQILVTVDYLAWVRAYREIDVQKISVKLLLSDGDGEGEGAGNDEDDPSEPRGESSRLAREMEPEMEVLLRPAVPRVVEVSDEDHYRETRAAFLQDTGARG